MYGKEEYRLDLSAVLQSVHDSYFITEKNNYSSSFTPKEKFFHNLAQKHNNSEANLRLVSLSHIVTMLDNSDYIKSYIDESLRELLYREHLSDKELYPWSLSETRTRELEMRAQFAYNVIKTANAHEVLRAAISYYDDRSCGTNKISRKMIVPTLFSIMRPDGLLSHVQYDSLLKQKV